MQGLIADQRRIFDVDFDPDAAGDGDDLVGDDMYTSLAAGTEKLSLVGKGAGGGKGDGARVRSSSASTFISTTTAATGPLHEEGGRL